MTDNLARISSFTNEGLTFEVIDSGPIDGDTIVLLHGWPQTNRCWSEVSTRLNALGYRTLMPNQRGYSPQARPKPIKAYRMSRLVGDIKTLVDQVGRGPVHIVGHDWGAAVAWAFAAHFPQCTRSLTSVSVPAAGAFLKAMLSSDQLLRSYYMALFQIPRVPEWIATRFRKVFGALLSRSGMSTEQIQEVYTHIVDAGALTTSLNWYRAMFFVPPGRAMYKVSVPVTHIWSDGDIALSRRSAELAEAFTTGPYQLEIVRGATHWLPEQNAEVLAELIEQSIGRAQAI